VIKGLVFNVQRFSTHDGPGIRTTVFLKGCPLACRWCHNPEGMSSAPELLTHPSRCMECNACVDACPHGYAVPATIGKGIIPGIPSCDACGDCVEACPTGAREIAGRELKIAELLETVSRDRVFYEESGGGVTFSGGEPLKQPAFVLAALAACREAGLHTAVDTCGLVETRDLLAAADLADLILFDLKSSDAERHRSATGVSNEKILANLRLLADGPTPIWLRVPLVPGVNDDDEELACMAHLASTLKAVRQVSVLPYHTLGRDKRERLGLPLLDPEPGAPRSERIRSAVAHFERAGIETLIGG
jgi:pyruvate formate lyase activating enzyme